MSAPSLARRSRVTSTGDGGGDWPRVGTTPAELVYRAGSLKLLRFRPTREPKVQGPPLLLVMPVINRSFVVDLTPDTSFVGALQEAGIDTFLIDWGRPTLGDRRLGLDEIVTRVLPRVERRVLAVAGSEELVLAGYCLGGTIAVCRAARGQAIEAGPERAAHAGLITIHTPVSFADAGLLGTMTTEDNFPVEALLEAFGNVPGWLLQQGFYGLKPLAHVLRHKRLYDKLEDREAVEEFLALERWNHENVPVTGAFYKQLIVDLYREDRLAKGTLELAGRRVSLGAIRCPVLVVTAEDDPICLTHQAKALLDEVSSVEKSVHLLKGGHVRSLTSSRSRHRVAARLSDWIGARAL